MSKRRWSNNDRHFGPITLATGDYWRLGLMLDSGDNESPGCHVRFYFGTFTVLIDLPAIIKPWRNWVDLSKESWAKSPGYWDEHPREFGFSYSEGSLHVHYGPQTHDSDTTKSKCYFIPWKEWRHVRRSYYGLKGEHIADEPQGRWLDTYKERETIKQKVPTARFKFRDFDGEEIEVTTRIEEMQWERGVGWFKWLSWVWPSKIRRSLDLDFSKEVGPEKGSFKGGTTGHSIDMLPGELHEHAFRRYCDNEHRSKYRPFKIEYIGPVVA